MHKRIELQGQREKVNSIPKLKSKVGYKKIHEFEKFKRKEKPIIVTIFMKKTTFELMTKMLSTKHEQ